MLKSALAGKQVLFSCRYWHIVFHMAFSAIKCTVTNIASDSNEMYINISGKIVLCSSPRSHSVYVIFS